MVDHRYSAPELLGGKHYGKSVDVWSIGICVYALMTGKLPFGNPESLTELHALILDGAYELPEFMTEPLKELFKRIFVIKPQNRITLEEIWQHEWLKGVPPTEWKYICNKKLPLAEVNRDVVSVIADLGMGDESSVLRSVLENHCNPASATYHLMLHKKHRMAKQIEDGKAAELARLEREEAERAEERTRRSQTGVAGRRRSSSVSNSSRTSRASTSLPTSRRGSSVEPESKWTQEQEFTPRRSRTHSVGSGRERRDSTSSRDPSEKGPRLSRSDSNNSQRGDRDGSASSQWGQRPTRMGSSGGGGSGGGGGAGRAGSGRNKNSPQKSGRLRRRHSIAGAGDSVAIGQFRAMQRAQSGGQRGKGPPTFHMSPPHFRTFGCVFASCVCLDWFHLACVPCAYYALCVTMPNVRHACVYGASQPCATRT